MSMHVEKYEDIYWIVYTKKSRQYWARVKGTADIVNIEEDATGNDNGKMTEQIDTEGAYAPIVTTSTSAADLVAVVVVVMVMVHAM